MNEYTVAAGISVLLVAALDRVLKTRLLAGKRFWIYVAVMNVFMLLSNGYLTWRPVVLYNPDQILGARLGTIPLEDFLYGFTLISLSVILWEFFKARSGRAGRPTSGGTP